jgi:hypothetical protein
MPEVLREAGAPALVAVAILALLLASGVVISRSRLWDGYGQRDGIVGPACGIERVTGPAPQLQALDAARSRMPRVELARQ